jgi:hypothetical protein
MVLMTRYSTVDGELVVSDDRGVGWRGKPDGRQAMEAIPLPGSDDAVVLLEYWTEPGTLANLVRLNASGDIIWRAELPTIADVGGGQAEWLGGDDAWVAVALRGSALTANSWSCFFCVLDALTGAIVSATFTK